MFSWLGRSPVKRSVEDEPTPDPYVGFARSGILLTLVVHCEY